MSWHGRARFCPYYFVVGATTELGGILTTVCPLDKMAVHGMTDAVMVPTAVATVRAADDDAAAGAGGSDCGSGSGGVAAVDGV